MLRRIITAIIVIPLLIVVVGFAVANRQVVTVSFDPFSAAAAPAYAVTLPLFVIIFILLIVGVIIGGVASWMRQSAWRRSARRLDAQVRDLHGEVDAMRAGSAAAPERREQPPLVLPPVA